MNGCDSSLFDWKVVLLMDHREFNHTAFIDEVKAKIDHHFNGSSSADRTYPLYCEKQALSSADYMFVARKIEIRTGTVKDERVLDLIIERKNVNDLSSCLIKKSKKYKPLSFFEAQCYKLQQCGIPRKVFLLEGDEDDPTEFNSRCKKGRVDQFELDKRLKRVKTLRLQLENGEWGGMSVVCTRTKEDSVQYFIDQMVYLKKQFNPRQPPRKSMEDVKKCVDDGMKGATFQEYLRLRMMKGIGDAKAMKTILDEEKSWDKTFVSPASTSKIKTSKSTLEDRAVFYISPSGITHKKTQRKKARIPLAAKRCRNNSSSQNPQNRKNQVSNAAPPRRKNNAQVTSHNPATNGSSPEHQPSASTNDSRAQRHRIVQETNRATAFELSNSHLGTELLSSAKPKVTSRTPLHEVTPQVLNKRKFNDPHSPALYPNLDEELRNSKPKAASRLPFRDVLPQVPYSRTTTSSPLLSKPCPAKASSNSKPKSKSQRTAKVTVATSLPIHIEVSPPQNRKRTTHDSPISSKYHLAGASSTSTPKEQHSAKVVDVRSLPIHIDVSPPKNSNRTKHASLALPKSNLAGDYSNTKPKAQRSGKDADLSSLPIHIDISPQKNEKLTNCSVPESEGSMSHIDHMKMLEARLQYYTGHQVSNPRISKSSHKSASPPHTTRKGWTCSKCTFFNENMCFLVCEVCNEERS